MGSNGSVIPYFVEQIKSGGPVTITNLDMTRFFLTLHEAIQLLFRAAEDSLGGEIFVMNMPACYIKDVAAVLMQTWGQVDIKVIGSKPGEKIDEVLISRHEAALSYCYDDQYFVILPESKNEQLLNHYGRLPPLPWQEFSSRSRIMDIDEIGVMLDRGGFL